MSTNTSVSLTGNLDVTTTRETTRLPIVLSLTDVRKKQTELILRAGAAATAVTFENVNVTEALALHVYCPASILVKMSSSDADFPGPIRLGLKGHWFLILSPGEGITTLEFSNPSTTDDTTAEVLLVTATDSDSVPSFWG